MSDDRDTDRANRPVCYCMGVDSDQIRAAIAAGARSVSALQDATRACTGCGTCRADLLMLLQDAGARRPEAP